MAVWRCARSIGDASVDAAFGVAVDFRRRNGYLRIAKSTCFFTAGFNAGGDALDILLRQKAEQKLPGRHADD